MAGNKGQGASKRSGRGGGKAKKSAGKPRKKSGAAAARRKRRAFDPHPFVERLEKDGEVFRNLVAAVGPQQATWRPNPRTWSILEVLCHLRDEEREDFRTRVRSTLFEPDEAWPPIDPPGWAKERNYRRQDLAKVVAAFVEERARSVGWLRGLGAMDWRRAYEHPLLGTLRAGDLLVSWVAHDCLHLRQLTRLHYLYACRQAGEFNADYAGDF
jgi:hypothetical protein